jgi:hypothetical protein
MMVFGSSVLERRLRHESGALRNEIIALIKETLKSSFFPSAM